MEIYENFQNLDIKVGKIVKVEDFPEARNPSYKLEVDFGEDMGVKKSSVQITHNYNKDELIGKFVLGIVNLPSRQIGPFISEVLILGVPDKDNNCILINPDKEAIIGGKVY